MIFFSDQNDSRFYCLNYCGRSYKDKRSLWRHLKLDVEYNQNLIVIFVTKNLMIINQ